MAKKIELIGLFEALAYAENNPMVPVYCVQRGIIDIRGIRARPKDEIGIYSEYIFQFTHGEPLKSGLFSSSAGWHTAQLTIESIFEKAKTLKFSISPIKIVDEELPVLAAQCGCQAEHARRMVKALDLKLALLAQDIFGLRRSIAH